MNGVLPARETIYHGPQFGVYLNVIQRYNDFDLMAKRQNKTTSGKAKSKERPADDRRPDILPNLERAMRLHGAGRLADAEKAYRRVLTVDPENPMALHLLGVVAHQAGDDDNAIELVTKAISFRPDYGDAHNNLGLIYRGMGRLEDAVASFRKAIAVKPGFAKAHYNMGLALYDLGRLEAAVDCYRMALSINPELAEAETNLGNVLHALERVDEAVNCHQRAIALRPDFVGAHYNLGNAFQALGRLEDAVDSYRRALSGDPDFAAAHGNLGRALHRLGGLQAAEESCRRAVELKPESAEALVNLGNVLKDRGRMEDAKETYEKALAIKPDFAHAHFNLGMVLRQLAQPADAVASYRKTLAADPDYVDAYINLGSVLHDMDRLDEAEHFFRRGLKVKPDSFDLLIKLGNVLRDIGFERRRTGDLAGDANDTALWDEALGNAERVLAMAQGNMAALGLKSSALVGLKRWRDWAALTDLDGLMQAQTMDVPEGYPDLRSFNQEILDRCLNDETLINRPCESMTAGRRIYNLQNKSKLGLDHPLLAFMNASVERYRAEHPIDASHPFLARRPERWKLDVWGSILEGEGQLQSHNHTESWLSGVYYAVLPDIIDKETMDRAGWIEFGRPPRFRDPDDTHFRFIKPREGLLILWPSFLFHGTIPYNSGGIRFSIAVDVVPAA